MAGQPPVTPSGTGLLDDGTQGRPVASVPARRRSKLKVVVAVLSVTVLLLSLVGYGLYRRYNGNIERIAGPISVPGEARPADDADMNVLLVGSDTRAGQTEAELRAEGTQFNAGALSDTVIIAHVPKGSRKVTLISFPRDSWVTIPAWTGPDGKLYPEHKAKLNAAFSTGNLPTGNPALLVSTVEQLSGMRIDHYAQIDFPGFVRMVNSLGGINVCLTEPAKDHYSGIDLPAGEQTLNGTESLAFVRQRHGLQHGDLDRIKRQQYFINAVVKKVTSAGTLLNPLRLNAFLTDLTKAVTVDRGMSLSDMRNLALRLRKVDATHTAFATIPIVGDAVRDGQDVLLVDDADVRQFFAGVAGTGSPSPSAAAPVRVTVPPSDVTLRVLNAGGVAGAGSQAARDLREAGFVVTGVGDALSGAEATVIRYAPTRAAEAATLAAAVAGSTLAPSTEITGIQLLVGTGFPGVKTVTVGTTVTTASPAAPSTPSTRASSTPGTAAPACAP